MVGEWNQQANNKFSELKHFSKEIVMDGNWYLTVELEKNPPRVNLIVTFNPALSINIEVLELAGISQAWGENLCRLFYPHCMG